MIPPLEDPAYEPKHPPTDGLVPDVVVKWGPPSQLRWFERYRDVLRRPVDWDRYYCITTAHRGGCCDSCEDDWRDGYNDWAGSGYCCCRAYRAANPPARTGRSNTDMERPA